VRNALIQAFEGDGLCFGRVLYGLGQGIAFHRNGVCFSEHRLASLFGCHFDGMIIHNANANCIPVTRGRDAVVFAIGLEHCIVRPKHPIGQQNHFGLFVCNVFILACIDEPSTVE
jgi:hypothetical protein